MFDIPTGLTIVNGSETRWGGTVGAGLEFGFAPNWSVGVEYDHLFMGQELWVLRPALLQGPPASVRTSTWA
ncbi:opacity protein-like surface antigen [Bradyrhizobium sp. LM2.7]